VGFVSNALVVGEIEGAKYMRVTGVRFYQLKSPGSAYFDSNEPLTDPATGSTLSHMCVQLAKYYASGSFYFSRDRDITLNSQQRLAEDTAHPGASLWDHIDERFFWNRYPLKDLIRLQRLKQNFVDRHRLLLPLIQGFVSITDILVQDRYIKVALISRLSCERAGTRLNVRGVDDLGHVANFVETEQYLFSKNFAISYVQIRGSVPVFWEQAGFQVGKADFDVVREEIAARPAFQRHFDMLLRMYGRQHVVNLLAPGTGNESELVNAYEQSLKQFKSDKIEYTNFDLNHEFRSNDGNLVKLVSRLQESLDTFQFFLYDALSKEIVIKQGGVFRTNCIDCLDR